VVTGDDTAHRSDAPATLLDHVSRSMFWNTILLPLVTLCNAVNSIVIRRGFGLRSGAYDIALGLSNTLLFYSSAGIPTSLTKFLPERESAGGRRAVESFLWQAGTARLLLLVTILVPANLAAAPLAERLLLGSDGAVYIHLVSLLVIARTLLELSLQTLHAFLRQLSVNLLTATQAALDPALIGLSLWLGYGIGGVIIALLASTTTIATIAGLRVVHTLRTLPAEATPSATARRSLFRDRGFWRFAAFTYVYELSLYFGGPDFCRTVLGAALGDPAQVALFAVAFYFALMVVVLMVSSFRGVYRPMFARLRVQGDREQLRRAFSAVSKVQVGLLLPAAVGLEVMLPDYIPLLYGRAFAPAVPVARLLVVFLFTETAFNLGSIVLSIDERYRPVLLAQTVLAASAPLFLWSASRGGLIPAVIVLGSARVAAVLIGYAVARRRYGVRFPWAFAARLSAVGAAMGAVLALGRALLPPSLGEAVLLTLGGVVVYAVGIRVGRVLGSEEADLLRRTRLPGQRWIVGWLLPATGH